MRKIVEITTEYITLGQLLKFTGLIRQGSMAKEYIMASKIIVNGEKEDRRGRKLYKGFVVSINEHEFELVQDMFYIKKIKTARENPEPFALFVNYSIYIKNEIC